MCRVSARLWCLGFVMALWGCGGRSTSTTETGGGGSHSQGGSDSPGATGNTGASSSVGATSSVAGTSSGVGGGTPSPGKCAAFDDETPWSMLIRFSNQTQRTIQLGQSVVTCA